VVLRMVCYCCWFLIQWWLFWLPALLLLDQVLACLPFSSLVSSWWLAFSSWSGTAPPCLDLQLLGFNPWNMMDGFLVCPGAVCKNSGVLVMVQCWLSECCFLWPCSSPPAAGSADCCGAAISFIQSDDWAACEQLSCMCHSLDQILPVSMWNGCVGDLVHMCCVPQNFKRTDTSLDQLNSVMQMAKDLA
jgi:hypothetical protein